MNHAPTGQHINMTSPNGQRMPHNQRMLNTRNANFGHNQGNSKNSGMDPFGRVNSKARKVIESVER